MSFLNKYLPLFLIFTLVSCHQKTEKIVITSKDYHQLVDHLTNVMIHDIYSPPVASRIYAYPNIAAYQVLNKENSTYKSLSNPKTYIKDWRRLLRI